MLETGPSLTSLQISLSFLPRSPFTFSLLACLCFLFMLACCLAWRFCTDLILLQHVRYVQALGWHMPRSCQKMSWWGNCFLFFHSALCLTVVYCSVVLKVYMFLVAFDIKEWYRLPVHVLFVIQVCHHPLSHMTVSNLLPSTFYHPSPPPMCLISRPSCSHDWVAR